MILEYVIDKMSFPVKYAILEGSPENKYIIKATFDEVDKAKHAFYLRYMTQVLNRNRFMSFLTNELLVEINNLQEAIEQTWRVVIPNFIAHSTSDMMQPNVSHYDDEYISKLKEFMGFHERSQEYYKKHGYWHN